MAGLLLPGVPDYAFVAAATREPEFTGRLTQWDEAAAWAIIGLAARAASLN